MKITKVREHYVVELDNGDKFKLEQNGNALNIRIDPDFEISSNKTHTNMIIVEKI